ncbi:MAG: methyltransferase domain-containing protein [bacterium]
MLLFFYLPLFNTIYAQNNTGSDQNIFPSDKRVNNKKLIEDINWKHLSCVFSNETNLVLSKPIFDKLKKGVYISVGGELGLVTGALSPQISYLLLLDIDERVVLYNRWKLGMIGISKDSKDLLYLIKKAPHQEIIDRVNAYKGDLPFGSKEALLDPFCFNLFNKYTRQNNVFGSYMTDLLRQPSAGNSYYKTNYHFYEDQYNNIKTLIVNNKAEADLGNVTEVNVTNGIVEKMKQKGLTLSALNLSDSWLFGTLFENKETVNNVAMTQYDPQPFQALVNSFKAVTNESSVLLQSKSTPEKDLSYVVYNFDNLYNNKNISSIPNLMYLVLDRKYSPNFSKGQLLVNPSLEFPELKDVSPVINHPEDGSVCTYNGEIFNWEKFKGMDNVFIRYAKSENNIKQTVIDYRMLSPEPLAMGKLLINNTTNVLGMFRKTLVIMLQTEKGFFLSNPIYSSTHKEITSDDIIKGFDKTSVKYNINSQEIIGCSIMYTYAGGEKLTLPLSSADVNIDYSSLNLPNVSVYNIYALPFRLNGNIIFYAQVENKKSTKAVNYKLAKTEMQPELKPESEPAVPKPTGPESGLTRKVEVVNNGYIVISKENGSKINYAVTNRFFENIAGTYGMFLFGPKNGTKTEKTDKQVYIPRLLDMLSGKKVLDVGMGESNFVSKLREKGIDAYGLDISLSEEFKSKKYYFERSINDTKFPGQSFDMIFSTASVLDYEYDDKDMMKNTLDELLRILKPGGSLLFTVHISQKGSERPYFISEDKGVTFFPDNKKLEASYVRLTDGDGLQSKIIEIKKFTNDRLIVKESDKKPEQRIIELLNKGVTLDNANDLLDALSEYIPTVISERDVLILNEAIGVIQKADLYTQLKNGNYTKLEEITKMAQEKVIYANHRIDIDDVIFILERYTGVRGLNVETNILIDFALYNILNKTAETITQKDLLALNSVVTLINDPIYYPEGKYKGQTEFLSYLDEISKLNESAVKPKIDIELALKKCKEIKANLEKAEFRLK